MPVEVAGKFAIIVCFLITFVGTVLLDRELNLDKWGLSLFSGIFLYSGAFKLGFINYVIGIAFAICAFWIWVRYRERADGIWIFVFTLSAGIVFFSHLLAFGIYAVSVFGYECSLLLQRLRTEGRLQFSQFRMPISAVASIIIPCLSLRFSPLSSSSGLTSWGYKPFWASLIVKIEGLAAPIYYSNPGFEIPLLIIIFGLFSWAIITRTIVPNNRMLISLGVFGLIFIVMPFAFSGSAYFADFRLPSGVAFIVLASFRWGKTSPTRRNVLQLLLSLCLVVRVGSVFLEWQPAQAVIEGYNKALQVVPPGSRLLVYMVRTPLGDRNPPLASVPVLAAAMHSVFDPDTFANAGEMNGSQLLNLKSGYRDYWIDAPPQPSRINDIKRYDYLLGIRQSLVKPPPGIALEEVKRGQTFVLYRIRRSSVD